MQYLSELPEISSISVNGNIVEFELEQRVEKIPDISIFDKPEPIVLTAQYAGQIVVAVGQILEHEIVDGPEGEWSRIKIKGSCVSFTI